MRHGAARLGPPRERNFVYWLADRSIVRSSRCSKAVELDVLDQRGGGRLDRQQGRTGRARRRRPRTARTGAPDELPALTTRFETVKGSRFSTLSVVLPTARRAGLTVTKAPATARSIDRARVGAVEHGDRRILAEGHLAQGGPGVGLAEQS